MNSEVIEKKILEDLEFDRMLAYWKFRERSVVALYGSFDVLHPGTFELIAYAAEHGHELVVGIKPDAEMKKEKGDKFPVFGQEKRALAIASNQLVSAVYICKNGVEDFLRKVKPSFAVCCNHASSADKEKLDLVKEWGGKHKIFTQSSTSVEDIITKLC
jgi:cytidyltransferase-like protein